MHKYFAKPLFLGKKVEFLPECHSTNDELNKRVRKDDISEGFVIHTDHQSLGRGQRGNVWLSEPGKNLLFSIYITPNYLLAKQSYLLNIACGLSILGFLRQYQSEGLSLKWPNDAYIHDRKVAGILVEASIEQSLIGGAVVGVGLNVNQIHFQLPAATSLKMETGKAFDREVLLEQLLVYFEQYLLVLKSGNHQRILSEYYRVMRWRGELHTFRTSGSVIEGEIIGLDKTGKLLLNTNNSVKSFDMKEIEFLY